MFKKYIKIIVSMVVLSIVMLTPKQAYAKSRLELVFIIDRSGSMDDDIDGVKNNMSRFVDRLIERGIDYNLGLLSYEEYVDFYPLTNNVNQFKSNLNSIDVGGSIENGLDAMDMAMDRYTFYENSVVYFILIGDESIYSDTGNTQTSIVNRLISHNIKVIAIGDPNKSSSYVNQFTSIANDTNGMFIDMNQDYSTTLDTIFEEIQELPTVNIKSPAANQWVGDVNGLIPTVEVTDPDSDTLTISYYIDGEATPRDEQTVTNSRQTQLIQMNAVDVAGLSEGAHQLKMSVFDGEDRVNDIVTFHVDRSNPTISQFTINRGINKLSIQGSGTDSRSGLANLPYKFDVGANTSGWVASASFVAGSLQPNTDYTVKFLVKDKVNHIATRQQNAYTLAEKPGIAIQSVEPNAITIKALDNNPNYTAYQVKVGNQYATQSGSLSSSPTWVTFTNKVFKIKGLAQGTSYAITLKAKNGNNMETGATTITRTTLAKAPSNIKLTPSQTSIMVTWDTVPGALGYVVKVDNGGVVDVGSSTTYTHSGLVPKITHSYQVATKNSAGIGPYSASYKVATLPYPPAQPQLPTYDIKQQVITLNWPSVTETDYYELVVDGTSQRVNENRYVHTGLVPESHHTYKLRAVNAGGQSPWTNELQLQTLPYPPTTPVMAVSEKTNTAIHLSWPAVEKAEGYQLKVDGLLRDIGMVTTYEHKGLIPLTTHEYQIRAYNKGGLSQWSEPLAVKTHPDPPKTPTNLMTTADKDKITLSWYQVEFAEYYEVEIDGSQTIQVNERTFVHTPLLEGEEHHYRVRAVNVSGSSPWSTQVSGITLTDQQENYSLTNLVAIVTNEFITLSWDAVDNNVSYAIEIDGNLLDLGTDTIYNHTGLQANEFHRYNIKVIDETGNAYWCANLALSTLPNPPDAPTGLKGDAYLDRIELRWDRVEGATAYEIEIDGEQVMTTTDLKMDHEPLEAGTSHTYRLRAKNITGVTSWSQEFSMATLNPEYLIDVTEGEEFTFTIIANNVQDFNTASLNITYDSSQIQVEDLFEGTLEKNAIISGDISNTNLSLEGEEGKLLIKVKENVIPGTSWSGEIMTIRFKALVDDTISLKLFVIEEE